MPEAIWEAVEVSKREDGVEIYLFRNNKGY